MLQELNIIPTLTVAENLFLRNLPHHVGIISYRRLQTMALRALRRVGLGDLDQGCLAGELGVGQQQLVEIASALEEESSVLILDEPTAALTGPEIELLFENVRALRNEGVAILYISHRMDEIAEICDRVTVMRDGQRVATRQVAEVDTAQLIRWLRPKRGPKLQFPTGQRSWTYWGKRIIVTVNFITHEDS